MAFQPELLIALATVVALTNLSPSVGVVTLPSVLLNSVVFTLTPKPLLVGVTVMVLSVFSTFTEGNADLFTDNLPLASFTIVSLS